MLKDSALKVAQYKNQKNFVCKFLQYLMANVAIYRPHITKVLIIYNTISDQVNNSGKNEL